MSNTAFTPSATLALLLAAAAGSAGAANLSYTLGDFTAADWALITVTDEGAASITMEVVDGFGNPGQYWQLNYLVPATTSAGSASNRMAAIYMGQAYDPAQSGALERLDFGADVRGISNTFSFATLGYLRPAILQDGVVYTALSSDFIPSTLGPFEPQQWTFAADSANWATAITGSTLRPDFSASGAPIYAGFRFSHFTQCTGATGCRGGTTFVGLDNFAVDLVAAPVPEPQTWLMLLAGLGLLGLGRRRQPRRGA